MKKTTAEMIKVMQAYEDGKEVQALYNHHNEKWYDSKKPIWNWVDYDYRIKEEKPVLKKDPYIGKCVIDKKNGKEQYIITEVDHCGRYNVNDYLYYKEDIKINYYIEGEDF